MQIAWYKTGAAFAGVVTKQNADGTFRVQYNDTDPENVDEHDRDDRLDLVSLGPKRKYVSHLGYEHAVYEWSVQ